MEITYAAAFIGGVLSIFAPCGAMLIPAFFSYSFTTASTLIGRTAVFWAGIVTALIPLGVAAGTLAQFLNHYRWQFALALGVVVIVLGIWQALALPFPHLPRMGTVSGRVDRFSAAGVYLLGVSYGLAGIGCSGPILGAILALSAASGTVLGAVVTMVIYGCGMVFPVAILALAWDVLGGSRWLRPRPVRVLGRETTIGAVISGVVFVILGIFLVWSGGQPGFAAIDGQTQIAWEAALIGALAEVPNWLFVIAGLLVLALIGVVVHSLKTRRKSQPVGD